MVDKRNSLVSFRFPNGKRPREDLYSSNEFSTSFSNMQTDNCENCGQKFVAKSKIVKEMDCNDCRVKACCEVRNSISN